MHALKTILFFLTFIHFQAANADINQYFDGIKNNPPALYAFLKKMPKGGELHYHLAGGGYPEAMLSLAENGQYCVNIPDFQIEKMQDLAECKGISLKNLMNNQTYYDNTIKAWSMKNFIPGKESGQEHFFNSFMKFMPLVIDYESELLVEVLERAADQNELYMEIMVLPDEAKSARFGENIKDISDFAQKRKVLLEQPEFQKNILATVSANNQMLEKALRLMHCNEPNASKGCSVTPRFLYYNLREQPLDNLFAQALNGFEAASRSKIMQGINLVQPEDGLISLKDYKKQMDIFNFMHQQYPQVHITLHAGELSPEAVIPSDLNSHIHDALFIGKAQRIGHGVSIYYENNLDQTLDYMARQPVPVEINLTSNKAILQIEGKQHPLSFYLAHNIPVVFSTDDEGILRTNLTRQYQQAVEQHNLDYNTIKQINRNALTWNFMPGASLWENPSKAIPVKACTNLYADSCKVFLQNSPKASLQWKLEDKLRDFERGFKTNP